MYTDRKVSTFRLSIGSVDVGSSSTLEDQRPTEEQRKLLTMLAFSSLLSLTHKLNET